MKLLRRLLLWAGVLGLVSTPSFGGNRRGRALGLLVGDPIAGILDLPVSRRAFLSAHGGIWTWHLWHDVHYDTPYLSVDIDLCLNDARTFYVGLGVAGFFADNPKDKHGIHRYAPEEYGVDPDQIRESFRPYMERFGLEPETS